MCRSIINSPLSTLLLSESVISMPADYQHLDTTTWANVCLKCLLSVKQTENGNKYLCNSVDNSDKVLQGLRHNFVGISFVRQFVKIHVTKMTGPKRKTEKHKGICCKCEEGQKHEVKVSINHCCPAAFLSKRSRVNSPASVLLDPVQHRMFAYHLPKPTQHQLLQPQAHQGQSVEQLLASRHCLSITI